MDELLSDLEAEQIDLERLVADLEPSGWDIPTPAEPWLVRDQISHLAFFDEKAALAASDPDAFAEDVNRGMTLGIDGYLSQHIQRGRTLTPGELLGWWREARSALLEAFRRVDPEARLPWYGPPMKARSSAAARLMENWAHGQDVADALAVRRQPTSRLRHVAELGVKTFSWSFQNRGMEVPEQRVRVELYGPDGERWVWNEEASQSISGPVEDFCLVVAQRRHYLDTALVPEGDVAVRWLEVAQVFAGPPGPGRPPTRV